MRFDILCIGEAMAELRGDGTGFALGFAGDSYNTAVYCRRLLPEGMAAGYLTRVGQDPLSDGFLQAARGEGLDLGAVARDPARNIGIYAIRTDAAGERSFSYWRDTSAARRLFTAPEDFAALRQAGLVYLSGITLAILHPEARAALLDEVQALRRGGIRVAFDSNHRPRLWHDAEEARHWTRAFWQACDIALPSLDDEQALFGDRSEAEVLTRLRDWGCATGALKRGAAGPLAIGDASAESYPLAGSVVDTTAAGDSFNGAYLAALLSGLGPERALRWGHDTARQVIGHPGAIVPSPNRDELLRG